jgi:hypothetical protein
MKRCFWTKGDGSRYSGNDGRYAPSSLLARIFSAAKLDGDKVTWDYFESPQNGKFIVASLLTVIDNEGNTLSDTDKRRLVNQAISDTVKQYKEKATHSGFLSNLERRVDKFLSSIATYRLHTSLSVDALLPKKLLYANCCITETSTVNFEYHEGDRFEILYPSIAKFLNNKNRYLDVIVQAEGYSEWDSLKRASDFISLYCGIYNLCVNWRIRSERMGDNINDPIGVVQPAPYMHFINVTNRICFDTYSYEPTFRRSNRIFATGSNNFRFNLVIDRLNHLFEKNRSYWIVLSDLLIRYNAAMSTNLMNEAFLVLWSVLERITGTVGGKYDETISRASWIYDDHTYCKNLLEGIRLNRNKYVHSSYMSHQAVQNVHVLRPIIERHLFILLFVFKHLSSIDDYAKILSMSFSVKSLQKQLSLMQSAINFTTDEDFVI